MEVNPHLTEKAQRDFRLVQLAIGQGDQKAYAELLNNYRDSLYFMMLKMTNSPEDADDLTIEAFGKAFKNLHQYTPDYAFSTWLFKIAANNCIDFMRKSRRIQYATSTTEDTDQDGYPSNIPSELPGPDERIMAKQKVRMMREVVEKLKPHYRCLIEMRYFREYSYEEIATNLELPVGTVKAQLFRAREFLHNVLKDTQETI
ncbi:MAG TPA: sigma-70 family RNA polymerase sigma factor [Bacteroidales bacterium]|nr:sigma-70 family RNA polymerase sigma factor [Bacteroidales bacterium]